MIYMEKVRSDVRGASEEDSDKVFITWNGVGHVLQSDHKRNQVNLEEGRHGRKCKFNLGSGDSCGSNVHSNHRELSEDLADSMAHNVNTARNCYKLVDKRQSSLKITKNLSAIMRERGTLKEEAATKAHPSADHKEPQSEEEAHVEIKRIPWTEEDIEIVRNL